MACQSDVTRLSLNSVLKEILYRGYGAVTDLCGTVWNKIGLHTFTGGIVCLQDFTGYDPTGATDSTAAFTNALLALTTLYNGRGIILVPPGLYAVNLVLTGKGYQIWGQETDYTKFTVGFRPYDTSLPTISFGNGTTATGNIRVKGVQICPPSGGAGVIGVKFNGCNRCQLDEFVIHSFSQAQIQITSSATIPTYHITISNFSISTKTGTAGSLGIDYNYGSQYVANIKLRDGDLNAQPGASFLLDLEANCFLTVSQIWCQAGTNMGIKLRAQSCSIRGEMVVDSDLSTDVLVVMDDDVVLASCIKGNITIDGVCSFPSGNSDALTGRTYIPYLSLLMWPQIQGQLGFQDRNATVAGQHTISSLNQRIDADNATFKFYSDNGIIQFRPKSAATGGLVDCFTGALQVRENAIAGTGSSLVLGKQTQTTVGAAGAASALPATPTGYLRFFLGSTEFVIPYYARV